MRQRASSRPHQTATLWLERLEDRDVPAVLIQMDYTYDTGFFKNNPDARAVIERVATEIGNSLTARLGPIAPSGSDTWTATFFNPATGSEVHIPNLTIGANALKVFVGARPIPGPEAGSGGAGGYIISGSPTWANQVLTRGHTGYAPWGGSIAFDSTMNWHFGQTTNGLTATKTDLYTVALHELSHVLGVGTSAQWRAAASGTHFVGPNATAVYGGPVPLAPDRAHWADGVTHAGKPTVLDPALSMGTRVPWTALDAAALRDLGWNTVVPVPAATPPAPAASPTQPAPPAAVAPVPLGKPVSRPAQGPVAVTGNFDGTVSLFVSSGGVLADTGVRMTPFVGYLGVIRVAGGDFNGDGVTDFAFTTGAGPQAVVQIMDGRDGSLLVNQTIIFPGFKGGLFIAAGDIDGDGIAELAVAADAGAGPHIQTFRAAGGQLQLQSSFFAFDNPAYRGGARVALGDLDRDGLADLVVTTGGQAEGRVAIYRGADLRNGVATRLTSDFIPFAGLWAGLNAAVGDLNGDGYAELALAPDRGGPGHLKVWSGATLAASPGPVPSELPLMSSFYGLEPVDAQGARLAIRDTNGDGRAELFVGSGSRTNARARVFTYDQVLTAAQVPDAHPLGALASLDGIYVG